MKKLEAIGGAYYLTILTNKVASAANIEYHARIIYQMYMRRAMIQNAFKTIEQAQDLQVDPFDLSNSIVQATRFSNPQAMIQYETMNETMIQGSKEKVPRYLAGNLFKENEVGILFGDEGSGKSVLGFQMAAAMASGTNPFTVEDTGLLNQCEPKKVLFYDFELERSEIYQRYKDEHQGQIAMKAFDKNFVRAYINPQFLDFDKTDKKIISEIEQGVLKHNPEVIFVDNMTFISQEAQDPAIATKLMMTLKRIQMQNPGLAIIVIAHTPKRDSTMPMESKHITGSKNIANFAKSIVAVGKSKLDPDRRYLKHCKCRNGRKLHDYDNVIECTIDKQGFNLGFFVTGYGEERLHLQYLDIAEQQEDMMELIHNEKLLGLGSRKIATKVEEAFGIRMAHTTIDRRYKKWLKKSGFTDPSEVPKKDPLD